MAEMKYDELKRFGQIKTEMKVEPITESSFLYEDDVTVTSEGQCSIEPEYALVEAFHAVMEEIKHQEDNWEGTRINGQIETIEAESDILQRFKPGWELLSQAVLELADDTDLPQLCRLCATPGDAMIHIFGPKGVQKNIKEQIQYYFPIKLRLWFGRT